MKFGQDKCAYIKIEKGNNTTTALIEINGLTIKPIQEGESYRYLGQDENIAYEGTVNKEMVSKEYLSRVKRYGYLSCLLSIKQLHITLLQFPL